MEIEDYITKPVKTGWLFYPAQGNFPKIFVYFASLEFFSFIAVYLIFTDVGDLALMLHLNKCLFLDVSPLLITL